MKCTNIFSKLFTMILEILLQHRHQHHRTGRGEAPEEAGVSPRRDPAPTAAGRTG
jgi:hypothetical protein